MQINIGLKKNAFSLLELMIVVVILGIVYTLSIAGLSRVKDGKTQISIETLREFLQQKPYKKSIELLCLNNCLSCEVIVDGNISIDVSEQNNFENFLDDSLKIYKYDYNYGMSEIQQKVYFDKDGIHRDVCFSYVLNKQGVGDQFTLEFKKKVYDFSVYFEDVKVYNFLEDVKTNKENMQREIF